jgi:hypothetical protein
MMLDAERDLGPSIIVREMLLAKIRRSGLSGALFSLTKSRE